MMPEEKKSQMDFSLVLGKIKGVVLNFLIPLVSLLITAVLVISYILPSFKSLPLKKADLEDKNTTSNILSTKVTNLSKLVDYQSALDENLEVVNKVLVPEPEVPRLLDQATQLAEKAGMTIDKLSYSYGSSGKRGSGFETVTVSMGTTSSYEQLILFMELVENSARYVSVPTFRYSISDKEGDAGRVTANFSLDSPYLFVQSAAVTDDPINIDITNSNFSSFMDMLKELDYYDFVNQNIEAEETNPEEEEEEREDLEEPNNTEPITQPLTPENLESRTEPAPTPTSNAESNSLFPTQ